MEVKTNKGEERKRGLMSKQEIEFIKSQMAHMSVDAIAEKLKRTPMTVQSWVEKIINEPTPPTAAEQEKGSIKAELRGSQKWLRLKQEFSAEELKFFEEEYISIMRQFKGNVLHTEEAQIFDCVKLEILKSRNMVARRQAREEIDEMEMKQIEFLAGFLDGKLGMSEKDKTEAFDLENRIQVAKSREEAKTHEWDKLQQRVEKIRSALMSNRDQRIKEIEDKSDNLLGVIRQLQNRDVQERKSRELQLGRMAGVKEHERLGESIQYDDGTWDSPILSVDTFKNLEDAEGTDDDSVE